MKKSKLMKILILSSLIASTSTFADTSYIVKWNDVSQLNSMKDDSFVNNVKVKFFERTTFGGYSVIVAEDNVDLTISRLTDSGLFASVVENTKIHFEKNETTIPVKLNQDNVVINPKNPIIYSIDLNKFKDPLVENEYYHDAQKDFTNGATSALEAKSVFKNNLGRKARVAVLDSGYFPHEDMETPKEQAKFIQSAMYYFPEGNYAYNLALNCLTQDPTNSGLDATCDASNIVTLGDQTNNALDKSWKPSKFVYNEQTKLNDPTEYKICINGHGLSVASSIAAIQNNGKGIASAVGSENIDIVPVKVIDSCTGMASTSDLIKAIYWAAKSDDTFEGLEPISEPVDVINLSLGSIKNELCEVGHNAFADAVDYAKQKGIVVVAALGNDGESGDVFTPATCNGVIPVSSNNVHGQLSYFSNYLSDKRTLSTIGEDMTLPKVTTTTYIDRNFIDTNCQGSIESCYATGQGTSYSAPIVSGLVSMVLMQNPSLNPDEIFNVIYDSGNKFHVNEAGNSTNMFRNAPENRIINFKEALLAADNETLHVGKTTVSHSMNGASDKYVQKMINSHGKDNVCSTYKLDWQDVYQSNSKGVDFDVYGTNAAEAMTVSNSTLIETDDKSPRLQTGLVIKKDFANYGVRVCKIGKCSEIKEFDFSTAELNISCL